MLLTSSLFVSLDLHIGQNTTQVAELRAPIKLLGTTKLQECGPKIGIEACENVPQGVALWVNPKVGREMAQIPVHKPTYSPQHQTHNVAMSQITHKWVCCVDVILIHSWEAEEG